MVDKKRGKTLKTFNLDSEVYREFSEYCKLHGISMSKRVENFIRKELDNLKGETSGEKEVKKTWGAEEHPIGKYC